MIEQVEVLWKRNSQYASLPKYAHSDDAGCDVAAAENVNIEPGQVAMVDLGFSIAVPEGWEMQVRSRSGLAKKGIIVANSPGTVDAGYRGPCKVLLLNTTDTVFPVVIGDRIAQFVLKQAPQAVFKESDALQDTKRGEGGFGSTGIK